jgi:hypothetical protein
MSVDTNLDIKAKQIDAVRSEIGWCLTASDDDTVTVTGSEIAQATFVPRPTVEQILEQVAATPGTGLQKLDCGAYRAEPQQ